MQAQNINMAQRDGSRRHLGSCLLHSEGHHRGHGLQSRYASLTGKRTWMEGKGREQAEDTIHSGLCDVTGVKALTPSLTA